MNPAAIDALRQEIVLIGRLMHQFELVDGTAGNISARLDEKHILTTPSGLPKGFLKPEQLIIVDLDGNLAGEQAPAAAGLRPTSELLMHLEAYRRRPDVNGVVHAHPIHCIALSIAGISLAECVIPEAVVVLGLVATTPYATPASAENQAAIADVILQHDAIVLEYHGSLTVGRDVWDAYLKLEVLEHTAKILSTTRLLGEMRPLPPEQVEKLLTARRDLGLARPGEEQEFCDRCGVPHPTGRHRGARPARSNGDPELDAIVERVLKELRSRG